MVPLRSLNSDELYCATHDYIFRCEEGTCVYCDHNVAPRQHPARLLRIASPVAKENAMANRCMLHDEVFALGSCCSACDEYLALSKAAQLPAHPVVVYADSFADPLLRPGRRLTIEDIEERYERLQRIDRALEEYQPALRKLNELTDHQRETASFLWSERVRAKVAASETAEHERERNQICVDVDW